VARSWVYELVARYRAEGETAFEARSRRPRSSPTALARSTVALIVGLRRRLCAQGLDAGADTIAWHLEHHHGLRVSRATIDRTLHREGLVIPAPRKRPRSSYIRFAAEQPNEMWQADFTHYPLTSGDDTEILSWLDDHALSVTAHPRVTGPIVVDTFRTAITLHGAPASTLTDIHTEFGSRVPVVARPAA
jgi:transposase InsO family protein